MEDMLFKGISYLEIWQPLCSTERNHLCNFCRGQHEEHFCDYLLNLSTCLSVMLSPPKPLDEIKPNLVCEILT